MANLVTVKYVGRSPAVEFDPDGLGEITVVLNETVEVSPEMAASLLEQPANWAKADPLPPSKLTAQKLAEDAK